MLQLLLAAEIVAAPVTDRLAEAQHAIDAGRTGQARAMLAAEIAKGEKGPRIERLLGELAFATGQHAEAFARFAALLTSGVDDVVVLERAVISAVKSGNVTEAWALAERAVASPGASWRAWNARGVIADVHNDYTRSDESYQRALAMAPGNAVVLNNLGWSQLLRGRWQDAIATLERAARAKQAPARAMNNLELARAALASDLPRRREGESDTAFAARLNDAGVAARVRGERRRAIAAFAQAIDTRGTWYERAAQNLKQAEAAQ